jgi:hypothetical protein
MTVLATIMPVEIHTKLTTEVPGIVGRLLNPSTTKVRVDSTIDDRDEALVACTSVSDEACVLDR